MGDEFCNEIGSYCTATAAGRVRQRPSGSTDEIVADEIRPTAWMELGSDDPMIRRRGGIDGGRGCLVKIEIRRICRARGNFSCSSVR